MEFLGVVMKELVHFDGDKVTFSMGVAMVADALSPFAAARHIVAQIGACVVEINQIDLERKRLQAQGKQLSAFLAMRQHNIALVFQLAVGEARKAEITASEIQEGFQSMIKQSTNRYISEDERLIAANLIPILAGQLVELVRLGNSKTINLANALQLGGPLQIVNRW